MAKVLKEKIIVNSRISPDLKLKLLLRWPQLSDEQKQKLSKALNKRYLDALQKIELVQRKIIKQIRLDAEQHG